MLSQIHPKLPMRNKEITRQFYCDLLGFVELGDPDFEPYFMCRRDDVEIHFFEFKDLNPLENYCQVYIRTNNAEHVCNAIKNLGIKTTNIEIKPWRQKEFSIIDPDHNLITFGETLI